jgi:hypothetical protein
MRGPQSDDKPRHADLHSYQIDREPREWEPAFNFSMHQRESAANARNLTLVASRSASSAIPRSCAASSRKNRAFIVNPFRVLGNLPMPTKEAVPEPRVTMEEGSGCVYGDRPAQVQSWPSFG